MKKTTLVSLTFALVAFAAVSAVPAQADYVGYVVTDKGEFPMPETFDNIPHKHLKDVKWGDYDGPKSRVAVLEVENNSNVGSYTVVGPFGQSYSYSSSQYATQVPVQGIEAMLTDSLHRTNRFRLVERQVIGQVLGEQDLGASGRVAKPSAAKIGKVLGAQYQIQAVVTSYEPNYKGRSVNLGALSTKARMLGGVKIGMEKSMVSMNFRLIDAETSEIVYTKQVDAIVAKKGLGLGGGGWGSGGAVGGFVSGYGKTPIGQCVMSALNMGVFDLIKQIGARSAQGSVIKASGSTVYINLNRDVVSVGDELKAVSMGEELIDPETGISLGGEEETIGMLEVTSAKEKFSIAKPLGFDASRLKAGDKVVSTKAAAPLQFADRWEGPTSTTNKLKKRR